MNILITAACLIGIIVIWWFSEDPDERIDR
jgi:hypothetical protein